ncbi:MAG TPA: ABC transporter permease [Candidatus Saccharimonadaceae bacterium]|nr:ABC transporter permease [Candidatus Saccharimonadaceae bacterium]
MALPLVYNLRNIQQRPLSTLTTALGVGLTVMIFIGALALAAGFRAALVSTGSPNNAIVLRKGADSEISSGVSREQVEILRSNPAVAAGPDGRALATADLVVVINKDRLGQKGSSNLTLRGVDPTGISVRANVQVLPGGRMFAPGTDEVIVGRRVAGRFANCAVGDRITFQQRTFTVVGHFAAGGAAFESEIWGDAAVLGPALNRNDVFQTVTFRMKQPAQFAALKAELEKDPRLQVQVKRESDFYAEQSGTFTGLITGLGVFITLIMGIGAVFGAANTMYASVGARTREIATLLVLGFRPGAILLSFLIESVLICVLGGVIGCILALPINGITTSTTNFQSFSEVGFAFLVTPKAMLAGLVFSAAMGLIGGFFPARAAARQPLARALRAM